MIHSIKTFLLVYGLLAVILITAIGALGDYYLSQKEVRAHMDGVLEQMGFLFASVASTSSDLNDKAQLDCAKEKIQSIEKQAEYFLFLSHEKTASSPFSEARYYFQLWNEKGKLMLYSENAGHINLDVAHTGLSDITLKGEKWRIFKIYAPQNPSHHINYVVGERYDTRNELLHRIALNNFYLMFIIFPLSAFLIWYIVSKSFKSLRRITNEVSSRAPSYLEPVNIQEVPLEIKPLLEELNQLFARLKEAFEREKRFAADAAHELRTPLAALKTQVQLALKSTDENERQDLFKKLIPAVDRIVHIIQQLLTLSRLVPEAASVHDIADINLSKLSAEIIAQLAPQALEKNIDIGLDAPSTLLIKGNLTGISVLIRNLVDNAIRYTPPKGHVTVELLEETTAIILRVIDTGPGIPEELHSRVFERFYRIIGNEAPGSGLGLAIVQEIVKLHQANINLLTPPRGTGLIIEVYFRK